MEDAGIMLKVSSEEYRLLLSMRNSYITVESLKEALSNATCDDSQYCMVIHQLLEDKWWDRNNSIILP